MMLEPEGIPSRNSSCNVFVRHLRWELLLSRYGTSRGTQAESIIQYRMAR